MADPKLVAELRLADATPGTQLFPYFESELHQMLAAEVDGLTDQQLDFESHKWLWAQWSIRRQVSHLASGHLRWLTMRWGEQLLPGGFPDLPDTDTLHSPHYMRRLDFYLFWDMKDIMGRLKQALELCHDILTRETVGSLRSKRVLVDKSAEQMMMSRAHPWGIDAIPDDPDHFSMTLEANFRHRYWEHLTHIYNVQRIRRVLELPTSVEVPFIGYWAMPDWDRSEA